LEQSAAAGREALGAAVLNQLVVLTETLGQMGLRDQASLLHFLLEQTLLLMLPTLGKVEASTEVERVATKIQRYQPMVLVVEGQEPTLQMLQDQAAAALLALCI
jgi:hypothetical protein